MYKFEWWEKDAIAFYKLASHSLIAILYYVYYLVKMSAQTNSLLKASGSDDVGKLAEKFTTLGQVMKALRDAGLKKASVVFGIDYTSSNEMLGADSFDGKCLHDIDPTGKVLNPYQQVMRTLGEVLNNFDDDRQMPAFGFGDVETTDKSVFPLKKETNGVCDNLEDMLETYNKVTPNVELSGPTSFAPVIYKALEFVKEKKSTQVSTHSAIDCILLFFLL